MADCRWPAKHRHASRGAALAAINSLKAHGDKSAIDMTPYPCAGHWHIGHDSRRFRKRIRNALAAGRRATTTRRRR